MKIVLDILNRLKSPVVLGWLAIAIAFIANQFFGQQINSTILGTALGDFINALFAIASVFAALNDPTNKKGF